MVIYVLCSLPQQSGVPFQPGLLTAKMRMEGKGVSPSTKGEDRSPFHVSCSAYAIPWQGIGWSVSPLRAALGFLHVTAHGSGQRAPWSFPRVFPDEAAPFCEPPQIWDNPSSPVPHLHASVSACGSLGAVPEEGGSGSRSEPVLQHTWLRLPLQSKPWHSWRCPVCLKALLQHIPFPS